jgi:hypothetical protein
MKPIAIRLQDAGQISRACGDCNRLSGHAPDCTYARVILGRLWENPEWIAKHGAKYGARRAPTGAA